MSRLALVAAVLLALPACSFGARGYQTVTSSRCSTSRVAPIIDTTIAVAGAGAAGVGFSRNIEDDEPGSGSPLLGFGFSSALVFATSAIVGYTIAGDCRAPRPIETTATR